MLVAVCSVYVCLLFSLRALVAGTLFGAFLIGTRSPPVSRRLPPKPCRCFRRLTMQTVSEDFVFGVVQMRWKHRLPCWKLDEASILGSRSLSRRPCGLTQMKPLGASKRPEKPAA